MKLENPVVKKLFFVTGVMRSGTTLLQRVISLSCKSAYIREESSLRVILDSFEILDRDNAFHILSRAEYILQYRRFIDEILAQSHQIMNEETLVLKDPLSLRILPCFQELMPATKFVISVRNPLATITSINRVAANQRNQGKKSFISAMGFNNAVDYVSRLCDVIIAMQGRQNVCIVRYEDLIARDSEALSGLQEFIGAEIRLDLEDTSDTYDPEDAFWTPESGAEIKSSSLDKYKSVLTDEQKNIVNSRFVKFNIQFGYDGNNK